MDPDSLTTIVYHSPCNDGFGAAYIAWLRNPQYEFIGAHPADAPPDVKGKRVLLVDISWSREVIEQMNEDSDALLILDHHKTAQDALADLPYAVFDMDRSGVMLAWDFFFPAHVMPDWLHYIGLRDLWRHTQVPDADAFTTAFSAPQTFEGFDAYRRNPRLVQQTINQGRQVLAYKNAMLDQMASKATDVTWMLNDVMYQVRVVNAGWPWTSDLGHTLTSGVHQHKVAFIWSKPVGGQFTVSLRSNDAMGPDVAAIATVFGGGGHCHAAAFRMDALPETLFFPPR